MSRQQQKLDPPPPPENDPVDKPIHASADAADDLYAILPPDPTLAKLSPPFQTMNRNFQPEDADDLAAAGRGAGGRTSPFHFQFTLGELFMLTTALAVLLGIMSLLRWKWQIAAGLAGVGAFVSLFVLTVYEPEGRVVQTIWWVMLAFYLLACLAAFIVG